MQQGSDVAAAMERAIKYPLPQKGANANRSLIPRLHIVDNQIEALPGDGSLSGPACLICVMPPLSGARNDDETAPPESSLILFNSNEALNLSDPNPTGEGKSGVLGGTVLLTGAGNTIVDGNLIRNNQTRPANGRTPIYSLFISPGAQGTMAAAGNILKGTSSLTDTRPDVTFTTAELAAVPNLAQLTKWQFLNSSET
jgi:hypothetical protein